MNLNDLMTSETNTQEPSYSWGLDFDVISAVEDEKKSAREAGRERLEQHLKQRSGLRKAIRSWEKSSWNKEADKKTVNTSTLADTFTDVMVSLWKDPAYMQERYWTSDGNIELINKMKWLQWGKFSWDIQNYIDGKNTDLTWLVNNMFPDYIAAKTWTPKVEKNKGGGLAPVEDNRSNWDKAMVWASQFRWSDIWLESERRPLKWVIEFWAWVYDNLRKVWPWIKSIWNRLLMDTPEEFNEKIDWWAFSWDYDYDRQHWYNWSYNQWKEDTKKEYYERYMRETNLTKEIDDNKGDLWFNVVDEETPAFKWWEIWSEVLQQILLDKWITNAVKWGVRGYKAMKWTKTAVKGTELATKWTEIATKWTEGAETALKNPATKEEAKTIWQKITDWFKKPWTKQDLVKAWAEWWKAWLEFQLIWDIQDWQLSDAQAYGISAWIGTLLAMTLWLFWAGGKAVSQPQEKLRTSLSRMWVKDVDEILTRAEAWAKDWTLPSALQRTTDAAVKEAKENVKKNLTKAGENLWNFRKNLWWSDLTVEDFNNTLNKSLTKRWIWAKIVERDGKYVVEWYPWEYGEVLNKITERMNSALENLKNKYKLYEAWENIDFWSNTSLFEDLISDLKSFSMKEPNAEVRQWFIEAENDLLNELKWSMTDEQRKQYQQYLEDYAKNKTKYRKVEELENKMNSRNVLDQPKMEDWQYMSDFLDELMSDWSISQWTKDRRIAAIFADSFYWVPVKQSDKVMYPSKAWWIEEIMRAFTRFFRNPRSSITWWWKSYTQDYVPSKTREIVGKSFKKGKEIVVWKTAQQPKQE